MHIFHTLINVFTIGLHIWRNRGYTAHAWIQYFSGNSSCSMDGSPSSWVNWIIPGFRNKNKIRSSNFLNIEFIRCGLLVLFPILSNYWMATQILIRHWILTIHSMAISIFDSFCNILFPNRTEKKKIYQRKRYLHLVLFIAFVQSWFNENYDIESKYLDNGNAQPNWIGIMNLNERKNEKKKK